MNALENGKGEREVRLLGDCVDHVKVPTLCGFSYDEIAIWIFLIGSILFTIDAILTIVESEDGISGHNLLYLIGSMLFVVGCLMWCADIRARKAT
jgi:hypothetical protein